ncbi:LysE/ArgO family amino acid transporter [Rhodococcoides kyotonense]|uniref:L-lysine exporter family protein LysE/ArgO n=1 Tax=Rhodococcoides kyotonense TaxID=398843 RepID=A0A239MXH3_9NOCA|nr:LysE/ArgO family amino acid transporter [Rhodococcus kyotonensis]SNT46872.1 L-lysine exporter family protein LysE/ArgO [Rhodococcus kyotonensis]
MVFSAAPTVAGFVFGLSLIVAIGAQNAFVLRQGIAHAHVLPVVAVCAASDIVLIAAGVAGAGALLDGAPALMSLAYWGGAAFLAVYACLSVRRAVRPSVLVAGTDGHASHMWAAVVTALALTWLNPHVYLDTIVLLGSVASSYDAARVWFGIGAAAASLAWFTGLGYGARMLRPVFAKPGAWRVLDGAIAVVMAALAVSLAMQALKS